MSERNKCIQSIILTVTPQGENNRRVCALSSDSGLFYATLYGGSKSKLRSLVQPFNAGKLWIYTDESKKSVKITDFEVEDCHLSLHTSLYKIWTANLACEILLKTHCAGDEKKAFTLFSAFINGIDRCDEKETMLGTIRFLWRYINLLGVQPEIERCTHCKSTTLAKNCCYVPSSGLLCCDCTNFTELNSEKMQFFPLNSNAIVYLASINELSPGKVRSLTIDSNTAYELKQFTFYLIEKAVSTKLKTIETGMGIL